MFVARDIPDGYAGTAETIAVMRLLARAAISGLGPDDTDGADWRVFDLASDIAKGLPRDRGPAIPAAVLSWMQASLRYVQDPPGVELVQHPAITLFERREGDCDDLATAFCALVGSLGYAWGFRTVGQDPLHPALYCHVYAIVNIRGIWTPADAIFRDAPLGWEPPLDRRRGAGTVAPGSSVVSRKDWT